MLPFVEELDPERIHVQEPFVVVLLCGGRCSDLNEPPPLSLRDAFYKAIDNPVMNEGEWLRPEDITAAFDFFTSYSDILIFETDLAQIVKLIVLFCESDGSAAELGAFTTVGEILNRLFVIVREYHWEQNSFIKLGPLRRIENKVGRKAIQVLVDEEVGIIGGRIDTVDKKMLVDLLQEPLGSRLAELAEPSTFDQSQAGHVIKLIVGLIQEYGALTFVEIEFILRVLNVKRTKEDLIGYLLCAQAVRWLKRVSRGADDYFVQNAKGIDAATFHLKESVREKNKTRRRAKIREHWKEKDARRFAVIQQALADIR